MITLLRKFTVGEIMRRSKPVLLFLSLVLGCSLFFGEIGPVASLCAADAASLAAVESAADEAEEIVPDEQNEGVVRPEELGEGLSRKSFEEIEGRRVTLRQPVMEVTDREVERDTAEALPDTFRFIDPDTGEFYTGEGEDLARIDFAAEQKKFEDAKKAAGGTLKKEYPVYPKKGLDKGKDLYFSNFVKYMLLRQTWYYRVHAMELAEQNTLQRHPAADNIYGHIADEAKAVEKHIISDPVYRSPLATGLYLAPGEVVTVTVKGLKKGQTVRLTTHQQDSLAYDGGYTEDKNDEGYKGLISTEKYFRYWDLQLIKEAQDAAAEGRPANYDQFDFRLQNQWKEQNQKVPCMGSIFDLGQDGVYHIGSIYGGPLYLQPTDGAVDLVISGAVETPHFILGVTTKEEFEENLRHAPGLIATLDVENGQLIGYSEYMEKCDDIQKVAYFWHSVFSINSSLNGRAYNYNITMAYDMHVPAGEAVALNSSFCAQPYGWFEACMNYTTLTTKGNWGTFHELGHVQAKTYGENWGMCNSVCVRNGTSCEGEVWNNTLILLTYTMLCNMDNRMIGVEHGEFVHPFTAVQRSMNVDHTVNDYHDFNSGKSPHFDQLSLYATLIHTFGPERFVDFFYTYKLCAKYCDDPRADFIYRIALVDHVNIFEWLNENYHGNVEEGSFTRTQWEYLATLPTFWPIAYRWANGIGGNETARKYEVDGKYETVFDLSEGNILSPKPFTIVDVTQPAYGTLKFDRESERVVYTPPKEVTETDAFEIVVATEGGRLVTLNVNFRLLYRGTYAQVWKLDGEDATPKQTVASAQQEIEGRDPDRTEESSAPGKASFTAGSKEREYYHLRFKFKATEAGEHTFYLKADDASLVNVYEGGEGGTLLGTMQTAKDVGSYSPSSGIVTKTFAVGDTVLLDCHLVNWGGPGNLYVGVKFPGSDKVVDIPTKNIVNALATESDLAEADGFEGWQPEFLDSIKDTSFDYQPDKAGWKIISAPLASAISEGAKDPQNLVDGKDNTFYHTSYTGTIPALPHTYILDCGKESSFNYFEFTRRNSAGNEKVYEYTLYGAPADIADPQGEEGYVQLAHTEVSNINLARYTERFETADFRYFKLVIERAQNSFTVLAELYAGIRTELQQTVRPKNFEKGNVGFTENSASGKLTAKGENAEYSFSFLGTGFDIFADTSPDYGTARVYLDDVEIGLIDLRDELILNKRVFGTDGLSVAEHTVRIVVTQAPFNISFINVAYATPVEKKDLPAMGEEWGGGADLEFTAEWRTYVQDYKTLTRIEFVAAAPAGYEDSLVRLGRYIRVYRMKGDESKVAFVYTGKIVSPMDSGSLFAGCASLREIVFGNFDTSPMRNAVSMFNGCAALETLDLSAFDTHQTLYLGTMFEGCTLLNTLDLSGFEVSEGANLTRIFEGCDSLEKIVAPAKFAGKIGLAEQFVDNTSKKFTREMAPANAGHVLTRHEGHTFVHHDAVAADCERAGTKAYDLCPCGELQIEGVHAEEADLVIPATGHTWGEWHIVKEPTETEEGLEERTCAGGHSETRSVAKLAPSPVEPGPGEPTDHAGNNTGLIAGIAVASGAVVIAAVAVAVILIKKKRKH